MFQLMRRNHHQPTVQIKSNAHQPTIIPQPEHRCAVCNTGGPFAWLAYRGSATRRRPVAWLCLYCLELGHSPYEFADRARAQHPDVHFVVFPGTSVEQEQDLTLPTETAA
jgi:hypothetical protein